MGGWLDAEREGAGAKQELARETCDAREQVREQREEGSEAAAQEAMASTAQQQRRPEQ